MLQRARRVHPLLIIILLAIAARLAYIVVFGSTLSLQTSGYDVYATNLITGHGYTRFADLHPDSDLPPGYTFFLVAVYLTLGRSAISVALVQIVCDVITLLCIYGIGKRIGGETTGLLAAAFSAFYPYLLFQNLTVNDTGLFIMCLAIGVWAAYRVSESSMWRSAIGWALVVGLAFGFAALTKTLVVLMLPIVAIAWWWGHWRDRRVIVAILGMGLAFGLVILPWIVRNTRLHGAFTLISTNDGSNLYQGNNPCVADFLLAGWDAQWVDCLNPTPPGLAELQESTWFRDQAFTYLRENPGAWPKLLYAKFVTLWSPDITPRSVPPVAKLDNNAVLQYETPMFQVARIVHLIYFTPLLLLGAIGAILGMRDRRPIWLMCGVPIAITVAYLIYHPSTRYRSPADPFLFILSAYSVTILLTALRKPAVPENPL
jgi:4-amino-4-deoxy-L-arabinose transferase-like glycosyltransferase